MGDNPFNFSSDASVVAYLCNDYSLGQYELSEIWQEFLEHKELEESLREGRILI